MTDTQTLIDRLSSDVTVPTPMRTPVYWGVRLIAVLAAYGVGAQLILGLRPDLATKLSCCSLFCTEVMLLLALALSSMVASVLAMYPDVSGKPRLLQLPYALAALFVAFMAAQFFLPTDAAMLIPSAQPTGIPCTVCIALLVVLPSALLFAIQRKGASVRPLQAGALAVLAASAIGCLALRLHEPSDDLMHMVTAHYLPVLVFAALGALIGKRVLKW